MKPWRLVLDCPKAQLLETFLLQPDTQYQARTEITAQSKLLILEQQTQRLEFAWSYWGSNGFCGPATTVRLETAFLRNGFINLHKARPVLIPLTGWIIYRDTTRGVIPYRCDLEQAQHCDQQHQAVFTVAGLRFTDFEGLDSTLLLETASNEALQHIDTRMPLVLARGVWGAWLAGQVNLEWTGINQFPAMVHPRDYLVYAVIPSEVTRSSEFPDHKASSSRSSLNKVFTRVTGMVAEIGVLSSM